MCCILVRATDNILFLIKRPGRGQLDVNFSVSSRYAPADRQTATLGRVFVYVSLEQASSAQTDTIPDWLELHVCR